MNSHGSGEVCTMATSEINLEKACSLMPGFRFTHSNGPCNILSSRVTRHRGVPYSLDQPAACIIGRNWQSWFVFLPFSASGNFCLRFRRNLCRKPLRLGGLALKDFQILEADPSGSKWTIVSASSDMDTSQYLSTLYSLHPRPCEPGKSRRALCGS